MLLQLKSDPPATSYALGIYPIRFWPFLIYGIQIWYRNIFSIILVSRALQRLSIMVISDHCLGHWKMLALLLMSRLLTKTPLCSGQRSHWTIDPRPKLILLEIPIQVLDILLFFVVPTAFIWFPGRLTSNQTRITIFLILFLSKILFCLVWRFLHYFSERKLYLFLGLQVWRPILQRLRKFLPRYDHESFAGIRQNYRDRDT